MSKLNLSKNWLLYVLLLVILAFVFFGSPFNSGGDLVSMADRPIIGPIQVQGYLKVDGRADSDQLVIEAHSTQTEDLLVLQGSTGTELVAIDGSGNIDAADLTSDDDLSVADDATITDDLTVNGLITNPIGEENVGLPSVVSANVITTTTNGALFTISDGEIWIVHAAYINITANFDCTGDDCALTLGDGNDADGFIVLADAEMQAADTVATGFAAGWQGMEVATRGVYFDEAATNSWTGGFIYAPSGADETIDVAVAGTDPAAGTATVYILYTRIQ